MTYADRISITCVMAVFLLAFLAFLWQSEVGR